MSKWIILLLAVTFTTACNQSGEEDHTHGETDGHDHGDALTVDTTVWTDNLELFVEYPVFVVGHTSRFAAHFTLLDSHQPVREGSVTVSLIKGDKGIRHTVGAPSSPGIFTPALQPEEAGTYRLLFDFESLGLKERVDLGAVSVYANDEEATSAFSGRTDTEPDISFLKEQAWKIDFHTAPANRDTIFEVVKTAGTWMPVPGTERTLSASTGGNVLYATPVLLEGKSVSQGQVLMRISGEGLNVGSIESEVQKAKAEFEQAQKQYERKKELFELEVVPASEFEEVKKRYEIAEANYNQLVRNFSTGGIAIRAPFNGYVKKLFIENGSYAETGKPLIMLGSEKSRMIKASVAPEFGELVVRSERIWLEENHKPIKVKGQVVSVGRSVTPNNPLLPVFIEIQSPVSAVEGSLVEVQLGHQQGGVEVIVPKSALLEDFGTYKVVVQLGGEGFELRPVKIGAINGDMVAITAGLDAGEWVVTEGAYQVKMASMAGSAPAHGHAH